MKLLRQNANPIGHGIRGASRRWRGRYQRRRLECSEALRYSNAAVLNGLAIAFERERQCARAGQPAEHRCADDTAMSGGNGLHVEHDETLRVLARQRHDSIFVGAPVHHVRLLSDRIYAVAGRDQSGLVACH